MSHRALILPIFLALGAALGPTVTAQTGPSARIAPREAGAVLAEIEALKPPVADAAVRGDPAALAGFREQARQYEQERATLIGELFAVDPRHAALGELLAFRWRYLSTTAGDHATVAAESGAVMATQAGTPLAIEAAYHAAWSQGLAHDYDAEHFQPAVARFAALAPGDPRITQMLVSAAQGAADPEVKRALLQRVADGDDPRAAAQARSTLVQLEGLGKPFALAFDDVSTGRRIDLADLRGKVVVIDFWATWCKPCVVEMPRLKELYAEYRERGVEFIGVSLDKSVAEGGRRRLLEFVADNRITWPQYYQGQYWSGEFSSSWGIRAIPAVFVVDPAGNLYSTDARGRLPEIFAELLPRRS